MNSKNTGRTAAFLKSKGLYLVLAGCVVAAGAASWAAVDSVKNQLEKQQPIVQNSEGAGTWDQPVDNKQDNINIGNGESASPSGDASASSSGEQAAPSGEPAGPPAPPVASFALPVDGEVALSFSGDELLYQNTLADWRTHNGVDIKGAADQAVTAAASGTVTRVFEDALWGTVVEQTSGNLLLRYAGLHKDVAVKEGDTLALGQTLGRLAGVPAEAADGLHLHFEVLDSGVYKDPLSLVG